MQGLKMLRRVLGTYSWHNPAVGYCQGMNMVAAAGLLILDEETTFWLLVAIVEVLLPAGYYSQDLAAAQADQRVLKDIIAERLPRVHAHLTALQIDLELVAFNWFVAWRSWGFVPTSHDT